MKNIYLVLALSLLSTVAHAGAVTCDELVETAKIDAIKEERLEVDSKKITADQESILRQAIIIHGMDTAEEVKAFDVETMFNQRDPYFSVYTIGKKQLNAVNLDYGDNSFIYFFEGTKFAGLQQEDGSVSVDGAYCDTDMDLF